ncbi:hypothetical protein E4U60_007630 [Claviceps pazoutovae]|uniref:Uncharacterized protein n=1 Tax=Claviceps pazoutovae TaxID=1649127 RepID=A0A9P7M3D1_9HYPO|nr:hypothetical protein E4U60_007630 [Claviceps pazoutovae]
MAVSELIFSAQTAIELAFKSLSAASWRRRLTELSEPSSSNGRLSPRGKSRWATYIRSLQNDEVDEVLAPNAVGHRHFVTLGLSAYHLHDASHHSDWGNKPYLADRFPEAPLISLPRGTPRPLTSQWQSPQSCLHLKRSQSDLSRNFGLSTGNVITDRLFDCGGTCSSNKR